MSTTLPRLDREQALALLAEYRGSPLGEVTAALPVLTATVTYSPIGGARLGSDELSALRADVLELAREHGYPGSPRALALFESNCARLLHGRLALSAHEASHEEAWSCLTCCWLLDIALWRFGPDADERRFVGNVNRNTFRRLWWRCEILGEHVDLARLGEDELVNIMERPTIAGDRRLARTIATEFLDRAERGEAGDRMLLMREAMKRLLRLAPFVAFGSLSNGALDTLVREAFTAASDALAGRAVAAPVPFDEPAPEPSPLLTAAPSVRNISRVGGLRTGGAKPTSEDSERQELAAIALDIARRTGRVTNMTLREVASLNPDEAREVFTLLLAEGKLVRRGYRRGTHYVLPDAPADTAAPPRDDADSALRNLLRRGR